LSINNWGVNNVAPVTVWKGENPEEFVAARKPKSTIGNAVNQFSSRAIMAVFRVLCRRSTIPFACGWYEVVRNLVNPVTLAKSWKSALSNWVPRSVVICSGTPHLDIQPVKNVCATVAAVMSLMGKASIQRVALSMQVSKYFTGSMDSV
jgi:hypothetical protein